MGMCSVITDTHRLLMSMTHSVFGVSTYFLGTVAVLTGYNTGFFNKNFYYIKLYKMVTAMVFVFTVKDALIIFLLHIGELWEDPDSDDVDFFN